MQTGRSKIQVVGRPPIDSMFRLFGETYPIVIDNYGKSWEEQGVLLCYAYWYVCETPITEDDFSKIPLLELYLPEKAPREYLITPEMVIQSKSSLADRPQKTLINDFVFEGAQALARISQSRGGSGLEKGILSLMVGAAYLIEGERHSAVCERDKLRERVAQFDESSNGVSFKLMSRVWEAEHATHLMTYELEQNRSAAAFYFEEVARLTEELEKAKS